MRNFCVLKTNIAVEGIHLPIVINPEYVILDGHHRVKSSHANLKSIKFLYYSKVLKVNYMRKTLLLTQTCNVVSLILTKDVNLSQGT